MVMNKLKNTIASGLTALVLASGCATTGTATRNTEPMWKPGVTDTGSGYEGIGCMNSRNLSLARTAASMRARANIMQYVKGVTETEGNTTTSRASGSLYGSRVVDTQFGDNGVCVKVFVPYEGVK